MKKIELAKGLPLNFSRGLPPGSPIAISPNLSVNVGDRLDFTFDAGMPADTFHVVSGNQRVIVTNFTVEKSPSD